MSPKSPSISEGLVSRLQTQSFSTKIVMRAPDELAPYAKNPRKHTTEQIKAIATSIQRFGFTNPVLIDSRLQIVAGHGRVAAARTLQMARVPTLMLEHLSEAEIRAYIIADNRLAEITSWDHEILATELQALTELNFDVTLLGFQTGEIDVLLQDSLQISSTEDPHDVPPSPTTFVTSRPGDLWLLGEHRLICGDARDPDVFAKLLGHEKAEFVFTDPPYNVPIEGHVCGLGRIHHKNFAMACGEMTAPEFAHFLETAFRHLAAHSSDGSIHDICIDWRHISEMLQAGRKVYSELKNLCVWNKSNAGMGTFYRSKHELVFVWKNGTGPHINNFELGQFGRSRTNVWDYPGVNALRSERRDDLAMHPTVKPVALVADAIKDCSRRGGIVLDAFSGSGTTIIAGEQCGRRARAIEIDPSYIDVSIVRWQRCTSNQAVLAETNESFDQVKEKRSSAEDPAAYIPKEANSEIHCD
jgi:16S rRNA G966 N2-methylase RsmD